MKFVATGVQQLLKFVTTALWIKTIRPYGFQLELAPKYEFPGRSFGRSTVWAKWHVVLSTIVIISLERWIRSFAIEFQQQNGVQNSN